MGSCFQDFKDKLTTVDLTEILKSGKAAVVGIGNRLRGDDAAGSIVAERLAAAFPTSPSLLVIDAETVPENYFGDLIQAHPEVVLFVDVADFGGQPGEWELVPLQALADKLPSTHTMSVKFLGQWLETERISCWLLAIQPKQIAFGVPMSREVAKAAEEIAQLFVRILKGTKGGRPDG